MKNLVGLFLFAVVLMMSSCNKMNDRSDAIYNEKFTENNFVDVAEKVKKDNTMEDKDLEYLVSGLKRLSFFKDSVNGKTVKEIIEKEEKYEKEYKMKMLESMANISVLRLNTKNAYLGVTPSQDQAQNETNNLFFEFANNYNKAIKNISGEIVLFYVEQGRQPIQLKPIQFQYTNPIQANFKDTIILVQRYSETDELAKLIRNNTTKISGSLNITNVEFDNGKK